MADTDVKIDESAFLFMKTRKPAGEFAQCITCAFFLGNRCENFGPDNPVKPQGSCGAYAPGIAKPGAVPTSRVTPTEAGYVERPVRCIHCRYFDPTDEPQTHCDLYTQLNLMLPGVFKLNRYVAQGDCCNANTEGKRDSGVFKPLGPIKHANVIAADTRPFDPGFIFKWGE